MGLSGLAIYKLLPKTNCKECGYPTCLAFAMKLAARQVELADCPHVSEEGKAQLDSASAPPIRLIALGSDGNRLEVGNETVLFRHEKTFYHQPGFFMRLNSDLSDSEFSQQLQEIAGYSVERVGQSLRPNGVAIAGDGAVLAGRVAQAVQAGLAVVIMAHDAEAMDAGLQAARGASPLAYAAEAGNWQDMAAVAKKHDVPLAVRAEAGDLPGLAALAEKIVGQGVENLVLDPGVRGWAESLAALTQLRRAAVKKNYRPLGFPVITFPGEAAHSPEEEALLAAQHVAKYAGLIVLDHYHPAALYSLLTLRQNIYTDPQVPNAIEAKLYEIGTPGSDAPVIVTTNFALTYFTVAGEVENSKVSAYICVVDTEGLGVLNAYADDKLTAERVIKAVQEQGAMEKVSHNKLIIPGLVAVMRMEIEDESGWDVVIGPEDAASIPRFLKTEWSPN